MKNKKFLLGLDVGTDSVGWCLTDENDDIIKKNGKSLWGVRRFDSFDAKEGCAARRGFRSARRRLMRRRRRIDLLQQLFAKDMHSVDPTFFQRMDQTFLHKEDRIFDYDYSLFVDKDFNDKDYYEKYPTIYHLRSHLIESTKKEDLRLIYLAMHHIVKYRGHFLFEGQQFKVGDTQSVQKNFKNLNLLLTNLDFPIFEIENINFNDFQSKVISSKGVTGMKETFSSLLNVSHSYLKNVVVPLISGGNVSVIKLFPELEKDDADTLLVKTLNVKSTSFEEDLEKIDSSFPDRDEVEIVRTAKEISDYFTLVKLLGKESYLSDAMVKRYNDHKEDLDKLKKYIHIKDPSGELFNEVFRKYDPKLNNYVLYIGSTISNNQRIRCEHCTQDVFYKYLKKVLGIDKVKKPEEIEDRYLSYVYSKMQDHIYLTRQNSPENGIFPYQLNEMELRKIISNQSPYYPFLNDKDNDGYVTSDKILSILKFKIPYYVGPLMSPKEDSKRADFSWIERTKDIIYPWNFDKVVNKAQSANNFITRMLNKGTYLKNEYCLAKNSLVFSEYALLSELNKLYINGMSITYEQKQTLIKDLFKKQKVTKKSLLNYFIGIYGQDVKITTTSGKSLDQLKTNLNSYLDFTRIYCDEEIEENFEMIEKIIRDITIFEDKTILKQRLINEYKIDEKSVKTILGFNYKGYGRISRKLLIGLKTKVIDKETGEILNYTILDIMEKTNYNLMEILNDKKYKFQELIEKENNKDSDQKLELNDFVDELYISPEVKRPLIQSMKIIDELEHIINHPIDEYYIECARSNKQEKTATLTRKDKILEMYKNSMDFVRKNIKDKNKQKQRISEINELEAKAKTVDSGKFRSDKYFLYFLQLGKCMYSGEPISLEELNNDSLYDIDHIMPKAIIKDDSIENRVLVKQAYNKNKTDEFPIPQNLIFNGNHNAAYAFYKKLYESKLIGFKKYHNLTRVEPLSDNERVGFINRQLVSTNQAVKGIIDTIKYYKTQDNKEPLIVFSKAENVSDFRREFNVLKARDANNLHHAHDAYLNIVVGRTVNTYFDYKMNAKRIEFLKNKKKTFNTIKLFQQNKQYIKQPIVDSDGYIAWNYEETLKKVRKNVYNRTDIMVTTRQYIKHGKLFKATVHKATDDKGGNLIALKTINNSSNTVKDKALMKLQDTSKYGGYSDLQFSCFCLVESLDKKGSKQFTIEKLPLIFVGTDRDEIKKRKEEVINYLEEQGMREPKIVDECFPLNINTIIKRGASRMCLTGTTSNYFVVKNINEAYYPSDLIYTIKKISKFKTICQKCGITNDFFESPFIITEEKIIISPPRTQKDKEIALNNEELNKLYEYLINKFDATIYDSCNGIKIVGEFIKSNKIEFSDLIVTDKINLLYNLISLLKCNRAICDLSILGGKKNVGVLKINKKLTKEDQIIAQSITGYYEKVIWDGKKNAI